MDQCSARRRQSWLPTRFFSSSSVGGRSPRRSTSIERATFGEVCGGATAECAAICCCCPLTIANFLVLAIYKIPAGLFRRALHRMRQRKLPEKGLNQLGFEIPAADGVEEFFPGVEGCEETEKAAKELEKEMWQKFYGTGFWRSPSQTHN
ncbi:uncharacterized protein LOC120154515 [Hibiscus syriacus]|uniref:uncharacterized protein LOC120154515 n=1 Tax=Hibiscus syriacus TaxID=106335 RepID=UPI00192135A7|nr:uncharacterized protein LOC120154515 [Hibiscus syriacus]